MVIRMMTMVIIMLIVMVMVMMIYTNDRHLTFGEMLFVEHAG